MKKESLIGILIDGMGTVLEMFTDGKEDGLIVVTDNREWYERMKDVLGVLAERFL